MPRQFVLVPALELDQLDAYHQDILDSLRRSFSPSAPTFEARFAGKSATEVKELLTLRLGESDLRSTFAVLTSLEARFRIDFNIRCRRRLKDDLSAYFRRVEKVRGDRIRLDKDILEGWKRHSTAPIRLISQLRDAFNFRDWVAHGRCWILHGRQKYDFDYVHLIAVGIVSGFSLKR